MIFLGGTVDWTEMTGIPSGIAAMTRTRHASSGLQLSTFNFPGGAIAYGNCSVIQIESGDTHAILLRPMGEDRDTDEANLTDVSDDYARSGVASPDRISGAFTLMFVNAGKKHIVVANDRFGICPIYYCPAGACFVFSSSLDAVVAHPRVDRDIDPQAVYDYVFFHCIPAPRTIYKGVAKMRPAELVVRDGNGARGLVYWQPSFKAAAEPAEPAEQRCEALVGALERAVDRRRRSHCGAFLSGGLDSSSVVGMLKKTAGEVASFTIGFDAPGYDESAYARIVANHFETRHYEYFVTPKDVCESLPAICAFYGEPFGNSSVIPTYHCARLAKDHGMRLMLAGDGGDELFAGNTRYQEQGIFDFYFKTPKLLRASLDRIYHFFPSLNELPIAGKIARYVKRSKMGLPDRLQSYNFLCVFDADVVFDGDWLCDVDTLAPWRAWRDRYAALQNCSVLQRMLYLDWKFTLADNDLVKVSTMCDFAGVNVCFPMLDDDIVAAAARISPAELFADGELRGFYKRAFAAFLPEEIIRKSKHGFGLPFGVWVREHQVLKDLAADSLAGLRKRNIFKCDFLEKAVRVFQDDAAANYYGELIWILMALELWFDAHDL